MPGVGLVVPTDWPFVSFRLGLFAWLSVVSLAVPEGSLGPTVGRLGTIVLFYAR